ncbi:MAG: DUF3883 domain-containing protein [Spirochaetales bacterium]|jgi:hypothetical protein|nr:DUF3883 domain-containing protein [Spirochaetales bacterium]
MRVAAGIYRQLDDDNHFINLDIRFIEVKTTRYGIETPFFVTKNELGLTGGYKIMWRILKRER